jgi:hypothetical protein
MEKILIILKVAFALKQIYQIKKTFLSDFNEPLK